MNGLIRLHQAIALLAVTLLAALFISVYITNDHSVMQLHTYSGSNAGVFIDLPAGHWCGFEYRGSVGPFCDVS